MPRSRNTRIRRKDTSRAEARRRYREEQRDVEADETSDVDAAATAEATQSTQRPGFAMPNVGDDVKALPQVFRKPLVWLPFGLLSFTFVLAIAYVMGALDDLPQTALDIIVLYVSLTLHPTTLFIFFIGGFVAPRASYMVGGLLGLMSGLLFTVVVAFPSTAEQEARLANLLGSVEGTVPEFTTEMALQTIGMGVFIGIFAGGFAAWYRRFLRSSQERARQNRMLKEQEQARKAKEQAREDKRQTRESRRKGA